MKNLHKFYYKDYFSLDEVFVGNTNRRLDYELLIDDTKKKELERQINEKKGLIKTASDNRNEQLKKQFEGEKRELEEQLSVNVNILKIRNGFLTSTDFVKKDRQNKPTRELLDEAKIPNDCCNKDHSFQLQISYPGLVTGIGINHEAKIEGEFKLGVHLDWTHGMPVVYGSSVKGVLRSAFKDGYVDASLIEKANKKEGIREDEKVPTWVGDEANHKAILEDIFEGNENGKPKSIYKRDIFFDAVIVKADKKGRILASDSITPHGGENHNNPLLNPKPITFMKIASGCTMEFRFKLVDTIIDDKKFTAAQKKTLFEEILKTVGVGAKTNVGYGQLK